MRSPPTRLGVEPSPGQPAQRQRPFATVVRFMLDHVQDDIHDLESIFFPRLAPF
jgi:hypothetical protein